MRLGREAVHIFASAEVTNERSHISIPPYAFMAWCLIKYGKNFYSCVSDFCYSRKSVVHSVTVWEKELGLPYGIGNPVQGRHTNRNFFLMLKAGGSACYICFQLCYSLLFHLRKFVWILPLCAVFTDWVALYAGFQILLVWTRDYYSAAVGFAVKAWFLLCLGCEFESSLRQF
jgi:hypothetical protein